MLGVELNDIESVPVGYLDTITMYPLNMREYLIARGVKTEHFEILEDCFLNNKEVPNYLHDHLLHLIYEYQIIGGMPSAVQNFIDTINFSIVRNTQHSIIKQYKKDISQYNPEESLLIKELFDLIPAELNSQNKRYKYTDLDSNARFRQLENNFNWLVESNVALPVYNIEEPKFPLLLSKHRNLFKLFLSDVGLLNSMLIKTVTEDLLARNDKVNYGSLYENLICQELTANGITPYFYNSKKYGEVDFVIESENNGIILIEVKSGKDYNRHRALNNILDLPNYEFEKSVVLCESNIEVKNNITYLPIYMAMFFR
jgi:predicted AAA+ superfamily ATPase